MIMLLASPPVATSYAVSARILASWISSANRCFSRSSGVIAMLGALMRCTIHHSLIYATRYQDILHRSHSAIGREPQLESRKREGARNFRRMPPVIDGEFNCPSNASWNPCADSAGRPICRIRVRVPCHKPILQPQNRHFQKIVTHRGDHKDHHKIRAPPNDHHKM